MLFSAQVVSNIGYFVAVLLLARGLQPPSRGTVAFVVVCAMGISRIASFGVTEAIPVFVAQRPAMRAALLSNLVAFQMFASAVVAAVLAGLLLLSGAQPTGLTDTQLAIIVAGTVVQSLVDAGNAYLIGCGRFRQRAVITLALPWLYAGLLAVALLTVGLDPTRGAILWVSSQAVRALLLLLASARGIGFARIDPGLLAESIRFGLRTWIGSLSVFLNFRVDQILMGFISSATALGYYAVAVNLSEVLLYLPEAVAAALLPFLATSDREVRVRRTLRAFRVLLLMSVVGVGVAALLGPTLLPALFGPAFVGSVPPFMWLLPGAFGFVALRVFSGALIASSLPGRSSLSALVSLLIGIGLDFALIPALGAEGAAIAASAAFLGGGVVAFASFRGLAQFPFRELVPRLDDLEASLAIRTLREVLSLFWAEAGKRSRAVLRRARTVPKT